MGGNSCCFSPHALQWVGVVICTSPLQAKLFKIKDTMGHRMWGYLTGVSTGSFQIDVNNNSKYKRMKDLNWLTVGLLKAEFHVCTGITKKMDLALVDTHPKDSFCYDAIKFDEGII